MKLGQFMELFTVFFQMQKKLIIEDLAGYRSQKSIHHKFDTQGNSSDYRFKCRLCIMRMLTLLPEPQFGTFYLQSNLILS